jgi:hypothetical protein
MGSVLEIADDIRERAPAFFLLHLVRQSGGVERILHLGIVRVDDVRHISLTIVAICGGVVRVVDRHRSCCREAERVVSGGRHCVGGGCRTEAGLSIRACVVAIFDFRTGLASVVLGKDAIEAVVSEIDRLALRIYEG